ncbi:hypothetical protein AAMO2058_001627700 [Amorphochlora amoebiformis]
MIDLSDAHRTVMYGGATVIACGVAVHLYSLSMGKWTINTCGSIVGALVCAVLATFALQKHTLFCWHPILMSAATLYLAAGAIDTINRRRSMMDVKGKVRMAQLHWLMMDSALLCMGFGMYAIYKTKNKPLKQHFTSAHSWAGLLALLLFGLSLMAGGSNTFGPLLANKKIKFLWKDAGHRIGGAMAFTMLTLTIMGGLYNKIVLLPEGWGGPLTIPESMFVGGNTWSFTSLKSDQNVYLTMIMAGVVFVLTVFPVNVKRSAKTN